MLICGSWQAFVQQLSVSHLHARDIQQSPSPDEELACRHGALYALQCLYLLLLDIMCLAYLLAAKVSNVRRC